MQSVQSVQHEEARLKAVEAYKILDSGSESDFEEICELVAGICSVPMAYIGFVGADREWFKARYGWPALEINRAASICSELVKRNQTYVIQDTHREPLFRDNPIVTGAPHVRSYAGAPIRSREGYPIGGLCVLDDVPRRLSRRQIRAIEKLARQVEALLELRRNVCELETVIAHRNHIAHTLSKTRHDMEATLARFKKETEDSNILMRNEANASEVSQFLDTEFSGIFYLLDVQGRMLAWNQHLQDVIGYAREDILNRSATDFFETAELKSLVTERIRTVLEKGSATVEANLLTKSGLKIPYFLASARVELGGQPHVLGMGIDISASYRSEATFQLRNRAMQASVNAIMITDLNGVVEYANPAFEKMSGYLVDEMVGKNCSMLQGTDADQPTLDNLRDAMRERKEGSAVLRNYRKSGEMFWNDVQIAPVRNDAGTVTHFVGVLNDITELKRYEGHLERQVNFDSLTGLANRNLLKDRIRQAITHAQRHKQIVTVGFVDLDNFKDINDTYGHDVGDQVLRTVADRLRECVRAQDTVARYGGDEFAFVLTEQDSEENVSILMRRILRTISQPFLYEKVKLSVSCSIGVSFYPRDGLDLDTLLRHADVAMYRAKEGGRNGFTFYTNKLTQTIIARLSLEEKLRQALGRDEFRLEYEPLVDVKSGLLVGAEARLVWQLDGGEIVSSAECLSLAEEAGLLNPIGEWVLNRACADNKAMQDQGLRPIRIAVKILHSQFKSGVLSRTVVNAIAKSGLEPRFLELELAECLLMQDPESSVKVLAELKADGLVLTANDFGVGFSSVMYLQRFALDLLKIDASFVEGIGRGDGDAHVTRSLISLGHSLDLRVMAEGVHTSEQLNFLRDNGCDEIEGDLVGACVPLHELHALLRQDRQLSVPR